MRRRRLVVAGLALATALVHLLVGGSDVVDVLLASALDDTTKYTLYAVWHMVSLVLFGSAWVYGLGASPSRAATQRPLLRFIALLWVTFGLLFLGVAALRADLHALFQLPQWMLLLPVGLLGLYATPEEITQ